MLGDPPTPAALAAGSPPLPVLTTILPPAPWLFTLTPSHWFSLLSRCRSTGGDGQRQPLPGPLGLGNQGVAPLQTKHPPSCTAHLLRRWAPASSRRARGSAGRRRAPRSGWHLGWAAPALGGPPPAACHGKEPPRQGTGPPPAASPGRAQAGTCDAGFAQTRCQVCTPGVHPWHPSGASLSPHSCPHTPAPISRRWPCRRGALPSTVPARPAEQLQPWRGRSQASAAARCTCGRGTGHRR